ncbi:hypothetical protein HPP92_024767 [Vanilla planifolia]|uniref:Uncharacterized protein n=1 Tax=Vanilla planifolia TaxID=51239 RepID=A0A835PFX8_VANPL|nr:hypothetical protein HPP92_025068 [Vanilla planifolia]KAG0453463.1 hypothetical protein HPP92_024767 [Vanilla planifolia]
MGGHQQQPPAAAGVWRQLYEADEDLCGRAVVGSQRTCSATTSRKYGDVLEAAVISTSSPAVPRLRFVGIYINKYFVFSTYVDLHGQLAGRPEGPPSSYSSLNTRLRRPKNTGTYFIPPFGNGAGIAGGGGFQRSAPIPPTWYYPAGSPPPTACSLSYASSILARLFLSIPHSYGYPYKAAVNLGYSAKFNHAAAGVNYFPVHYSHQGRYGVAQLYDSNLPTKSIPTSSSLSPASWPGNLHHPIPFSGSHGHVGVSNPKAIDAPTTWNLAGAKLSDLFLQTLHSL